VPLPACSDTGKRELTVRIIACLQTHGSRVNWHPHLRLLVTDGSMLRQLPRRRRSLSDGQTLMPEAPQTYCTNASESESCW